TPPDTLTFPWPEKATRAVIVMAGPGHSTGRAIEPQLAGVAVLLTFLFQYSVPALLLAAGAALENGSWYKGLITTGLRKALIGSLKGAFESEGSAGPSLTNAASAMTAAASGIAGFIVSSAAEKIAVWLALKSTEAETID